MTDLLEVIRKAHSARGDDHCIHDLDLIFEAAGLPIPPREVGDKAAMLRSCERFVTQLCTGGGDWASYADLEKRIAELEAAIALQPASVQDDIADAINTTSRQG